MRRADPSGSTSGLTTFPLRIAISRVIVSQERTVTPGSAKVLTASPTDQRRPRRLPRCAPAEPARFTISGSISGLPLNSSRRSASDPSPAALAELADVVESGDSAQAGEVLHRALEPFRMVPSVEGYLIERSPRRRITR